MVGLGDCLDLGLGGTWPWFRLGPSLGGCWSCGVSVCGGISLLDYFKMLDVYLKWAPVAVVQPHSGRPDAHFRSLTRSESE